MASNTFSLNSVCLAILLAACSSGGLVNSEGKPTDSSSAASGGQTAATGGESNSSGGADGSDSCEPGALGGQGGEGGSAPSGQTVVARHGHLRVEGTQLVGESGEAVQLRGVSSMWLNWENEGYALNLNGVEFMRDNWGAQIIRAAMGVDVDGGYATGSKANMVAQVNQIVENAEALGMYVIVDFHSHNALDFRDEAIEFFSDISARYGHLPNLILEPFNEPLDVSWATDLKPYHEAVLAAIRESDPDEHPNVAILGTPRWDQEIDDVIG